MKQLRVPTLSGSCSFGQVTLLLQAGFFVYKMGTVNPSLIKGFYED